MQVHTSLPISFRFMIDGFVFLSLLGWRTGLGDITIDCFSVFLFFMMQQLQHELAEKTDSCIEFHHPLLAEGVLAYIECITSGDNYFFIMKASLSKKIKLPRRQQEYI